MSYNVGLPFMKTSFNPVSRQANRKTTSTGHIKSVMREMFDERIGRDKDIEHNETINNIWLVANKTFNEIYHDTETGEIITTQYNPSLSNQRNLKQSQEFMQRDVYTVDEYLQQMQQIIDENNKLLAERGKRKLRNDCVCCVAGIVKVPMQIVSQADFDSIKFYQDSLDVLNELFNDEIRCGEINAAVIHRDEYIDKEANLKADHLHYNVIPYCWDTDENGNKFKSLNGKKFINKNLFNIVNRNFPKMMREKGWDLADCIITEDLDTQKEKKEHQEQAKGKDAIQYKAEAEREKERLLKEIEQKTKRIGEQQNIIGNLENEIKELKTEKIELQKTINEQKSLLLELKNTYNRVLEKVKKLVSAIQPLERLQSVLNTIWTFPREFMLQADKLAKEFELEDDQLADLEEFYETAKEADYTLADVIELAKDVAESDKIDESTSPIRQNLDDLEL